MNMFLNDNAAKRRFQFVNYTPKFEEWLEWAKGPGQVDPLVIDYLSQPQFMFHWFNSFDYIPAKDSGPTSNPALWEGLSNFIKRKRKIFAQAGYDLSKLEYAQEFVRLIKEWCMSDMPYETADYFSFVNDVMTGMTPQDYKKAWTDPKSIVFTDDERKTSGRKINKGFGTNGSGLGTPINEIAKRLYNACPDKITSEESAENFMEHLRENFDNVAEFIDYFYSDGTKMKRINGTTSFLPYVPVGDYMTYKSGVVKELTRLVMEDLQEYAENKLTKSDIFVNGSFNGENYQVSEYFIYLLEKAR
jgi:hypothetical protein